MLPDSVTVNGRLVGRLMDEEDKAAEEFNLNRIADVAGRSFKKLRRNWSIKKEDITKGLSKIKRNSKNLLEDVYIKEGVY